MKTFLLIFFILFALGTGMEAFDENPAVFLIVTVVSCVIGYFILKAPVNSPSPKPQQIQRNIIKEELSTSNTSMNNRSSDMNELTGLFNCPDCNKEISRRATSCPNCGCPAESIVKSTQTNTQQTPNVPKCPTCQSNNIEKISTGNKVGKAAMIGVFALGSISKTFKCNSCGYQW